MLNAVVSAARRSPTLPVGAADGRRLWSEGRCSCFPSTTHDLSRHRHDRVPTIHSPHDQLQTQSGETCGCGSSQQQSPVALCRSRLCARSICGGTGSSMAITKKDTLSTHHHQPNDARTHAPPTIANHPLTRRFPRRQGINYMQQQQRQRRRTQSASRNGSRRLRATGATSQRPS